MYVYPRNKAFGKQSAEGQVARRSKIFRRPIKLSVVFSTFASRFLTSTSSIIFCQRSNVMIKLPVGSTIYLLRHENSKIEKMEQRATNARNEGKAEKEEEGEKNNHQHRKSHATRCEKFAIQIGSDASLQDVQ